MSEPGELWPSTLGNVVDADIRGSLPALRRAAASARAHAIQTRTGIVVRRDGRPVFVSYEELLMQQDTSQHESPTPT